MASRIIRVTDIATTSAKAGILPVSAATIWRWVRAGKFPKPFKIGPCVTAWDMADVERFIAERSGSAI